MCKLRRLSSCHQVLMLSWDSLPVSCTVRRLWQDSCRKFFFLVEAPYAAFLAWSVWAISSGPPTTPRNVCSAGCCVVLLGRAGRSVISAVQWALLDCFGHRSAKESDDGAGVITTYHGAAWHNHVGSCLKQTYTCTVGKTKYHNIRLQLQFFSPLHTCEWCRVQRLRPLQCLTKGTDSSTSSPASQAHRLKEEIKTPVATSLQNVSGTAQRKNCVAN